jgi:hypothetical protein
VYLADLGGKGARGIIRFIVVVSIEQQTGADSAYRFVREVSARPACSASCDSPSDMDRGTPPSSSKSRLVQSWYALTKIGDLTDAEGAFGQALALSPGLARPQVNLGLMLERADHADNTSKERACVEDGSAQRRRRYARGPIPREFRLQPRGSRPGDREKSYLDALDCLRKIPSSSLSTLMLLTIASFCIRKRAAAPLIVLASVSIGHQ